MLNQQMGMICALSMVYDTIVRGSQSHHMPPRTLINCLDSSSERVDTTGDSVLL